MTKLSTIAIMTAVLLATAGLAQAQASQTVRIATNAPYRPMEYTTPSGELTGFDIDLGNALCKQANLKCSWTQQSWNGIIPGLMAHRYDAIMSSMTMNAKRKKHLLFSEPYIKMPASFFVPKDSAINEINKQTLKGKTIGVQRGTVQDEYATDHFGSVATVRRYPNANGITQDMLAGRLDAAFLTQITGRCAIVEANPGNFRRTGEPQTHSLVGIAFRKNAKELAGKFNKALAALKENGTYTRIHEKYFGKDLCRKLETAD